MINSTESSDDTRNKMRDIAEALRVMGIPHVVANYSKDGLVFEYHLPNERRSSHTRLYSVTCEMCQLFMALLNERYPEHTTTQYEGRFEWNVDREDLVHRHTVTHTGL